MKLSDLIIEHGPFTAGEWISGDIADVLMTAAAVNELREELMAARAALQAGRFEVDGDGSEVYSSVTLRCTHCGPIAEIETLRDGPVDLAELNQRAGEHAEVRQ